jgi:hypothetical protein
LIFVGSAVIGGDVQLGYPELGEKLNPLPDWEFAAAKSRWVKLKIKNLLAKREQQS